MKIAIIGAGVTGLVLANKLNNSHQVTVYEKSRGVGGRLATRYTDDHAFDFGDQFFVAKDKAFQEFIQPSLASGALQFWQGRFVEVDKTAIVNERLWDASFKHYVGSPKMTSWCKELAKNCTIKLETKITALQRTNQQWQVVSEGEIVGSEFDWVIIAVPAEQALALLPASCYASQTIATYKMTACYSLMLGFDAELPMEWHAALVKNNIISWVSLNHTKPSRNHKPSLVTLSTNAFADQHIDAKEEWVSEQLQSALFDIIGKPMPKITHHDLHRWRYANIPKQSGPQAFIDQELQLAVGGDWCRQGIVEAAFQSASYILSQMN